MILNNKHISVTKNLYDALRHIRSENSNREIWVDALCINQADVKERNHQVSLMGDIYSSAELVINWLAFDMRYRKATDRRDMLYGLRNMVPEEVKKHIIVDYSKPVEEVYAEFYKAVEEAYQAEIEFVERSEKQILEQLEAERKRLKDLQRSNNSFMGGRW
ncbi:hypothetical protein N0V90_011411 [Kalmusia sp. IMI 367209]|nr:hypothetical protein N0V90_011411 [Kalmusia sp. IMI 367209]